MNIRLALHAVRCAEAARQFKRLTGFQRCLDTRNFRAVNLVKPLEFRFGSADRTLASEPNSHIKTLERSLKGDLCAENAAARDYDMPKCHRIPPVLKTMYKNQYKESISRRPPDGKSAVEKFREVAFVFQLFLRDLEEDILRGALLHGKQDSRLHELEHRKKGDHQE